MKKSETKEREVSNAQNPPEQPEKNENESHISDDDFFNDLGDDFL